MNDPMIHDADLDRYNMQEELIEYYAATKDYTKFLEMYKTARELYPIEKTHQDFYFFKPGEDAKRIWREDTVASLIPCDRSDSSIVLNIGSGYIGEMSKKIPNIIECDMHDANRYKGDGIYFESDARYVTVNMPEEINSEAIDIVICMEMLEHVPPTQTFDIYRQFNELLPIGGTLIISTPWTQELKKWACKCPMCNMWVIENGHIRKNNPAVIEAELRCSGFVPEKIIEGDGLCFVYKAKKVSDI